MADLKRIQQLDLNLLKIFEGLYQQQNMTRAAEVLNLSPSAVSHAISRLREVLGDALFTRQGKKMMPTPACVRIAPVLLDSLAQLRVSLQMFSHFEPLTTQQCFTVAIHHSIEPHVMPHLFRAIQRQAPLAKLDCVQLNREQITRQLTSGRVDVVIDIARPLGLPLHHQAMIDDEYVVLMANDHPLMGCLNQEAYIQAQHIGVSSRPSGPFLEDISFLQDGINRDIRARCQSFQTAVRLVQVSELLLTLPASVARDYSSLRLAIQPLPITLKCIATHLYWHENSHEDASLSWFRDLVFTLGIDAWDLTTAR